MESCGSIGASVKCETLREAKPGREQEPRVAVLCADPCCFRGLRGGSVDDVATWRARPHLAQRGCRRRSPPPTPPPPSSVRSPLICSPRTTAGFRPGSSSPSPHAPPRRSIVKRGGGGGRGGGGANTCAILQCSGASYRTQANTLAREGSGEASLTGPGRRWSWLISA